jgi:Domain of unknown function (DUF4129)
VNTRTVDPRTTWAVLAMEGALILPIMSLPTQGDRLPGPLGPLLLLLLLPVGCAGIYALRELRDPSWRLLTGMGLALATRAIVSTVPEAGLPGVMLWLAHSVVPAAIGIGLWWRGGALAVAELTPADVRTEFSVLAICLVVTLSLVRPFLLPDPLLLGAAVGLFAVAGLIGTALSRQDAAEVTSSTIGRALAVAAGLLPAAIAVVLVGSLRPELLDSMWLLVARAIELLLTPIGLLLAWLASLLPQGTPAAPTLPPPLPTPFPDPAAGLGQAQERLAWVGTVIVFTLLLFAGLAALLAAKLLLSNFIRDPEQWATPSTRDDLVVETSGTPADEVSDLFSWLLHWLRAHLAAPGARSSDAHTDARLTAWQAYRGLLEWAEGRGLGRRASETTGQLARRLSEEVPEAAAPVELLTRTFEWERYGGVTAPGERLRRVREALATLITDAGRGRLE